MRSGTKYFTGRRPKFKMSEFDVLLFQKYTIRITEDNVLVFLYLCYIYV